ncbi:MAG: hypothetical protein E7457_03405 [Ruminococcaceae bacterium]|nr:hypothetical protein [Oscillospiraceae bacterium]
MKKGLCPHCRRLTDAASKCCTQCGQVIKLEHIPADRKVDYNIMNTYRHYPKLSIPYWLILGAALIAVLFVEIFLAIGLACLSIPLGNRLEKYYLQELLAFGYDIRDEADKAALDAGKRI